MHPIVRIGRRWLYAIHRWIGICACLLFALWFVSGAVMMYVPYPRLTDRERMTGLQPIDWAQVRLGPAQALGDSGWPRRLTLQMVEGEPAYRMDDFRRRTVSARDGRALDGVDARRAEAIARRFAHATAPAAVSEVEQDQWTVGEGFDGHRPLYKVAFADGPGSVLYVSSSSGEVVLDTRRTERAWNWVGTVPHWLYFTALRSNGALWTKVILWSSGVGIVGALTGLWLGVLRLAFARRTARRISPYTGWMQWHHVGGLVAGASLTTWVISGWLSMNPNGWFAGSSLDFEARAAYAAAGASFPFDPATARLPADVREVRFVWVAGRPEVVLTNAALARTVLDGRTGRPLALDDDTLFAQARAIVPGAREVSRERLTREDVYWYAHHREPRLPILRVKFADQAKTWIHIDPLTGELAGTMTSEDRASRWAFNFLHDFDLPVLLNTRPTWDILMLGLLGGGLLISVSGAVIGWRRLKLKATELGVRFGRNRAAPAE